VLEIIVDEQSAYLRSSLLKERFAYRVAARDSQTM